MNSLNVEIRVNRDVLSNEKILVGINEIPFPTAIYFPDSNRVLLNNRAFVCLGLKVGDYFNFDYWIRNNNNIFDLFKSQKEDIISNQKGVVVFPNGKHELIKYSMAHINNQHLGDIYIINFTKLVEKYSAASINSLYNIQDEVSKLKPYLSRTGRNMVESLMKKYFIDENQQLTLDDIVYYKNEIEEIGKAFPSLSHKEVILCGLLVNNMETKDIAAITNRTIDSVFVTIHRINKKLNIGSKKELILTLKEIVFSKRAVSLFN